MKRCHICFTRYSLEDFIPHLEAHHRNSGTLNQFQSTQRFFNTAVATRHAPSEACNCRSYGLRDYCELLQMEAA